MGHPPDSPLLEGLRHLRAFVLRQGRFKSIVVEDLDRLAWLCHYIHLNPVRAGICGVKELRTLGFCSYQFLWDKRTRPRFLDLGTCLKGAGCFKDTSVGRNKYAAYLSRLEEDEPLQKRCFLIV